MIRRLAIALLLLAGCEKQVPGGEWVITWQLRPGNVEHRHTEYGSTCHDESRGALAIGVLRGSRRKVCRDYCVGAGDGPDYCQVQCEGEARFISAHCSPRSKARSDF